MAKEYIEREEVLKEQKTFTEYDEGGWDAAVRAVPVDAIKNFPAADVVEVVRCAECQYFGTDLCALDTYLFEVTENGFCNYGERRTDDDR